jgi:hypothetical protein
MIYFSTLYAGPFTSAAAIPGRVESSEDLVDFASMPGRGAGARGMGHGARGEGRGARGSRRSTGLVGAQRAHGSFACPLPLAPRPSPLASIALRDARILSKLSRLSRGGKYHNSISLRPFHFEASFDPARLSRCQAPNAEAGLRAKAGLAGLVKCQIWKLGWLRMALIIWISRLRYSESSRF